LIDDRLHAIASNSMYYISSGHSYIAKTKFRKTDHFCAVTCERRKDFAGLRDNSLAGGATNLADMPDVGMQRRPSRLWPQYLTSAFRPRPSTIYRINVAVMIAQTVIR